MANHLADGQVIPPLDDSAISICLVRVSGCDPLHARVRLLSGATAISGAVVALLPLETRCGSVQWG